VFVELLDADTVLVYPTVTVALALLTASSVPITASEVFPTTCPIAFLGLIFDQRTAPQHH
jgi:hypothetical protein